MSIPHLPPPRIDVTLKGLVALCIGRDYFEAAIIKSPSGRLDGHKHNIDAGDGNIIERESKIDLRIDFDENTDSTSPQGENRNIELFRPKPDAKFDREEVLASMDWALDIEKELYDGNVVGLNNLCLPYIFRMSGVKHGLFYTTLHTRMPVEYKKGPHPYPLPLYSTAFEVKAEIALPKTAHLIKWDPETLPSTIKTFTWEKDAVYTINIDNFCEAEVCGGGLETLNELILGYNGVEYPFISVTKRDRDRYGETLASGCPVPVFGKRSSLKS